jgi:hypothetical protein
MGVWSYAFSGNMKAGTRKGKKGWKKNRNFDGIGKPGTSKRQIRNRQTKPNPHTVRINRENCAHIHGTNVSSQHPNLSRVSQTANLTISEPRELPLT